MNFTPPLLRDYRKKGTGRDRRDGRGCVSRLLRGSQLRKTRAGRRSDSDLSAAQRHFLNTRCRTLAVHPRFLLKDRRVFGAISRSLSRLSSLCYRAPFEGRKITDTVRTRETAPRDHASTKTRCKLDHAHPSSEIRVQFLSRRGEGEGGRAGQGRTIRDIYSHGNTDQRPASIEIVAHCKLGSRHFHLTRVQVAGN